MSKPERGLPKDFELKVPDRPVQLGDYLDEPPPSAPRPRALITTPPPPAPAPVEPIRVVAVETPPPAPPPVPVYVAPPPAPAVKRGPPPRKQFNMTPETLRMIDELLAHIRTNSAERDVRASELIHALVLAVHEVRPFLDLSHVPPRGKWGSASAAGLPVALKDAFQQAIARSRTRY